LDQTNDGNEFSYDIFQKMKERFTTTTELSIPFFSFILHPRGLEEFQRNHSKIFLLLLMKPFLKTHVNFLD
jgi:predicted ATP-dependent serine protease